jgi:hypothetical protein
LAHVQEQEREQRALLLAPERNGVPVVTEHLERAEESEVNHPLTF